MKKKANPNLQIFGATTMMVHLVALVQEIEGVRQAKDIEAVHRMRVATRRLRATLPLFGPTVGGKKHLEWIKSVRGITRALGEARDKDVQIEHVEKFLETLQSPNRAGVRRLLLRLNQERLEIQPGVIKALNIFEKNNVVTQMAQSFAPFEIFRERLDSMDPGLLDLARQSITEKLQEFLAFDEIVQQPEKIEELHAMRIAAKRLRYTLETFAPLFSDGLKDIIKIMRNSQDMLGEIHDCDGWLVTLPQFIEAERQRTVTYFGTSRPFKRMMPGLSLFQEVQQKERDGIYQSFCTSWENWKSERIWVSLIERVEALQPPVIVENEIENAPIEAKAPSEPLPESLVVNQEESPPNIDIPDF